MKRILLLTLATMSLGLMVASQFSAGAQQSGPVIFAVTAANNLISFNAATPGTIATTVAITGLSQGETIAGIDFRPRNNQLYAVSSANRIYTINTTTGAATAIGAAAFTPALSGTAFGVDFNPVPDRIRLVSDQEQNLRLNPDTGAVAATDAALTYAMGDVNASANPNIVGAAYTNNFNAPSSTTMYAIDSNLDILVRQGSVGGAPDSPNNGRLSTIGALGVDTTDQVGFDILAPNDIAYASLTTQGATASTLYAINLNTGAATRIDAIGGNALIRDIAIPVTFVPTAQQAGFAVVNSASFTGDTIAPDAIVSIFGNFATLNNQTAVATTVPLPTTLGGVRVSVNGTDASMFFAAPGQINIRVPSNAPEGQTVFSITDSAGAVRTGTVSITRAAPGLFTANATGLGPASGIWTTDGINFQSLTNANRSENPVDPGTAARPTVLVLFGTGLRNARADNPTDTNGVAEAVTATIQGVPAPVLFAGRNPDFEGLDQINVQLPSQLAGLGSVNMRLVVNGQPSNFVSLSIGGTTPAANLANIAIGQTLGGTLTATDQVIRDDAGRTYFFDAYRFSATSATGLAIDVRSSVFDAAVILYKRNADGSLTAIAADDNLGGMGDGDFVNNNALLLTAIEESGDYVLFVTSSPRNENGVGGYTVRLTGGAVQGISYGANISGAIASTDALTSAGVYLDAYWFSGVAGDQVQINMSSAAFDPLLLLSANTGDVLNFDDNGGGGTTAQITATLPRTGVYVVIATPFATGLTGAYNMTLMRQTPTAALSKESNSQAIPQMPSRLLKVQRLAPDSIEETRFEAFASRRIVVQ